MAHSSCRKGVGAQHKVLSKRKIKTIPVQHRLITQQVFSGASFRETGRHFDILPSQAHHLVHQTCRRADPVLYKKLDDQAKQTGAVFLDLLRHHRDRFLSQDKYVVEPKKRPSKIAATKPLPVKPGGEFSVSATQLRRQLLSCLDAVQKDVTVIVESHGRPLAKLGPADVYNSLRPVRKISCEDFRSSAKEVLRLVAIDHYSILVCRYETPVAALTPIEMGP